MDNNNLITLADISFEGKNYQDSYNKYSKIIEEDINTTHAWIGKGLSAGYLCDSAKSNLDEVMVSLNYALKLNPDNTEKKLVLNSIIPISEFYIRSLIGKARGIVDEKAKEPLSTFQLQATRSVQQTAERYKANNEIFDSIFYAIEFTNIGNKYEAGMEYKKKQVELIDTFLKAINSEIHEERKRKLLNFRNDVISEISNIDSSYTPSEAPKSGGCFIASEIYGSYSHPKVLILREFRDSYLSKSKFGREFISIYYKHSPSIALKISDMKISKTILKRIFLEPIIWLVK